MGSLTVQNRSRVFFLIAAAAVVAMMAFLVLRTEAHGQAAPPPPPPPNSEAPEIVVTKDASVTSVDASGTTVTFTVTIENVGPVSANISEIDDDQFGNLLDPANPAVENNTCVDLAGDSIPVDGSATCSFDAPVRGECDSTHTNEVTVRVYSDRQFPDTASDTADVEITCPTPTTTPETTPDTTPETTPTDPTDGDDPTPGTDDPELTATADPPTPATTGMGVADSDDGFGTEASLLAGMLLVVVSGSLVVRAQRRRS